MQHVHDSVQGFRCLARTYGDTVLVATLIIAAISFAVSVADLLSASL